MRIKILILLPLIGLLFSCEKEQPKPEPTPAATGTLELKFEVNTSEGGFEIGKPFQTGGNRSVTAEELKFYVQNAEAVKENGETVQIKDLALIDFTQTAKTSHGEGIILEAKVPTGKYKGIRFRVGLDSLTNLTDPTRLAAGHPLQTANGMHWTWSTGYKFFVIEGKADNSPSGGQTPSAALAYHTGMNELSFVKEFLTPSEHAFEVKANNYTHFIAELRVDRIFDPSVIDLRNPNQLFTHSMPMQMPFSRKVNEQIKKSITGFPEK